MALTSPHMGLRIWNLPTDLFDHDQLADNHAKLDLHDHTLGRGVQIPTDGLADGAVTSAKLATNIDPGPVYGTYKPILQRGGPVPAAVTAGTSYYLGPSQTSSVTTIPSLAAGLTFYINPVDLNVSGRTTYYRIRASVLTNTIAPLSTYTVALVQPATWGGATGQGPSVNSVSGVVAGTPVVFVAPALGGPTAPQTSADFVLAAGWYMMVVTVSAATSAQPVQVWASLDYRQV